MIGGGEDELAESLKTEPEDREEMGVSQTEELQSSPT